VQNANAETNLLHQILLKCKHKKQKEKQGKCNNPLLDYVVPFSHSSTHHGHGKHILQVLQNHLRLSFDSYQNDFVEKNQPGKKDCLMMLMLMKRNNASSNFQPTPTSTFQVETYHKIFTNCNCSLQKNIEKICPKAQISGYHKSIKRNLPEPWISVRRKISPSFCKPDADDAPVKSLIRNASDPFYASTSSLMGCDSTFQAQRLCLHQIC
jgi:hypothetical protein